MNSIFSKANCNSIILLSQILYLMFCFTVKKTMATEVVSNVDREQKIKKPQLGDRGFPTGRRRGGTSRSDCPVSDTPLTAIIPKPGSDKIELSNQSIENTNDSRLFLAQTIAEYPTFWFYIPQVERTNRIGEFVLQDDRDRDIYRSIVNLSKEAGILNLKLPNSSKNALKIGGKYHWYLKVYCGDKREDSGYLYVDAWIERIELAPKIQAKLDTEKVDRHQILIDRNLWYDAIDSLAKQQVDGATDDWRKLLTSLGLSDLIGRDILDTKANFQSE